MTFLLYFLDAKHYTGNKAIRYYAVIRKTQSTSDVISRTVKRPTYWSNLDPHIGSWYYHSVYILWRLEFSLKKPHMQWITFIIRKIIFKKGKRPAMEF